MTTLVIKGTKHDAITAANRWGIALKSIHETPEWGDVKATTRTADGRLQQWFGCEPSHSAPFPAGSLLHFNV